MRIIVFITLLGLLHSIIATECLSDPEAEETSQARVETERAIAPLPLGDPISPILNAHLLFLDSVANGSAEFTWWTDAREEYSIQVMEHLTGIPRPYGRDRLGLVAVDRDDVLRWRNWLEANYSRLKLAWYKFGRIEVDSTDMPTGLSDFDKADSVLNADLVFMDSVAQKLFGERGYSCGRLESAMLYMEDLTGIESEAPSGSLGRFTAEPVDLVRWRKWLEANRNHLMWDPVRKQVVMDSSRTSPD